MKTIRLAALGDDVLTDAADAATFRKRLGPEVRLDFSGIRSVTLEFLDALFAGYEPTELVDMLVHTDGVADTLERWLDRMPATQRREPRAPAATPTTSAGATTKAFEAPALEGDRYTPTRLVRNLRERLTRYLEGAYPLNNPTLIKARRFVLERDLGGRLLAQDPFVETTPRYRAATMPWRSLDVGEDLARLFEDLSSTVANPAVDAERTLLFPSLYAHQQQAFEHFLGGGHNLLVATGTGSGKTECFLVPILGSLYREASGRPERFAQRGVRALILYPMNALVNDQLARLRLLFGSEALAERFRAAAPGGRHPTFGMYTGRTLYPGLRDGSKDQDRVQAQVEYHLGLSDELRRQLQRMGRYPSKDLQAFLAADRLTTGHYKSGKKKGQTHKEHHWGERLRTGPGDRELLTRHEMVRDEESGQGDAPDILVTNYSMLEYMLMRPFERPLFEQTRAWLAEPGSQFLLVLDEAHMYRGARGAEVAFLLRRLRARLGVLDNPEKFSVICTSASLGQGEAARANAANFAADLAGLEPKSFRVVTGEREVPTPAAPGGPELAAVLAAIDLDALHAGASFESLRAALDPLFLHLRGRACDAAEEGAALRELHDLLKGREVLHELLRLTAGRAIALDALAQQLFPESPVARKAAEVLLTLGALARPAPEEPGLLPTRVHLMFRGLPGLYGCLNRACPGAKADPGVDAPVGKLFTTPRPQCDACGARVLELASCRECGAVYLRAYAPEAELARPRFLWGDAGQDLVAWHLLPETPREAATDGRVVELEVQLSTGAVLSGRHRLPPSEVRTLWGAVDPEGPGVAAEFRQCPMCQPPGGRRQTRVLDFRTRGEQSFTALIEAQFAEQPPQKPDPSLPNRGRKVLVFSDGRQKAARLAPALETNHAADVFRQVLSLAARALAERGDPGQMQRLYPLILEVCARRGIELFPNAPAKSGEIFRAQLDMVRGKPVDVVLSMGANGMLEPPVSYADALFREVTDRFFSLSAIGLAVVAENPASGYLNDFPAVGLEPEEVRALFRNWLRVQLERRCFLLRNVTRFAIGEDYERPEPIVPGRPTDLLPERFQAWLMALLGDTTRVGAVVRWFQGLFGRGLLWALDDGHYLQPLGLTLQLRANPSAPWFRCASCNRLHAASVRGLCYECLGALVPVASDPVYLDARSGYYRNQVLRALAGESLEPFGLVTAEHSAQLAGLEDSEGYTKTERYELRFQDIPVDGQGPIDVLSCTTTMEVGIDIGTLCGVALRNVPPHVANYQQRAGRAGRRGRSIASVVTYAHGGSHDASHFEDPAGIIAGDVRPPVVYIENQAVLERHINAFLLQVFFHETVPSDPKLYRLFESLGTVESFLSENAPCSLGRLSGWLRAREEDLRRALAAWVPTYSYCQGEPIDASVTIAEAIPRLLARLENEFPRDAFLHPEKLSDVEREGLARLLEEPLLTALIDRAILPRYAFPTDTVSFWVGKVPKRGEKRIKAEFEYQPQRDLAIALTEYAPTRELTIDKKRFRAAALYNPYGPPPVRMIELAEPYVGCADCGFVSLQAADAARTSCPVCSSERLRTRQFVRPAGFAPDINVEPPPDRGGSVDLAGQSAPAKIEVGNPDHWEEEHLGGRLRLLNDIKDLVVVNKGIRDRGFRICPNCGASEPEFGPGFTRPRLVNKDGSARVHDHPLVKAATCGGHASGPYFLGYTFRTEVLLLRLTLESPVVCPVSGPVGAAGRSALTSLAEAFGLAATRALQIDEGELASNWNPVLGSLGDQADLYLYDVLPGGAGYTREVRRNLTLVLDATERLLAGCGCAASCYRCLRHYGNQILHPQLDRHLALTLLRHILRREVPAVAPKERSAALAPLREMLRLRDIPFELEAQVAVGSARVEVPLRVHLQSGATWVDVHHPLIDPERAVSEVLRGAEALGDVVSSIDTWSLRHDLPGAYRLVTGEG